ncbi:MAG: TRAP transporter large permease subunit [Rhodospirillales bacterium]|nr:TRAP transporter large permease subunit [Rhodospirillales bacterium]
MTVSLAAFAVIGFLVLILGSGVWVGLGLFGVGISSLMLFKNMPIDRLLAQVSWNTLTSTELIALPLFIFMAEILFRTKLSASLFRGLAPWTTWLPGRLLHINVMGCTLFAAISGSSAATTATVGRITLTELLERGYDRDIAMGSLAGAGTLGFLIPPSVIMIIYGVLAQVSILKLFIAGVIPGLCLAATYMIYLGVRARMNPNLVGKSTEEVTWAERITALRHLGPVLFLIIAVLGSMYGGIASPTEAAAVGVFGAFFVSIIQRSLTWQNFNEAVMGAARTTSMVGLIIAGAVFLSTAMGFLGIPRFVAQEIGALNLGPFELIVVLLIFYGILGCVLEGLSSIVMTLSITLPLVTSVGYDPIWFGVFVVLVVEMAQITPPVGFNLFVIQGLTGESIGRIARAALPFFFIMISFTILISIFPEIVMYLPNAVVLRG